MNNHHAVIVVGGGHAGLGMSYWLKQAGIDHLVFDRGQIADTWRVQRWDAFCLVTPNWQCQLPGYPYQGNDPDGFMVNDEIIQYIESYAAFVDPPLVSSVEVTNVALEDARFKVETSNGQYSANNVVVATGAYHYQNIPKISACLPKDIIQLHSSEYKNSRSLPDGSIMVVGTGQSGCQIAEDLHLEKRHVHLCVGRAPRTPREYRGKDCVKWLDEMGHYKLTTDDHPEGPAVRFETNHYVTGRGGGHEINLRDFSQEGMTLHGQLLSVDHETLTFTDDLKENLDNADAVAERIKRKIDNYISENNIQAPREETIVNTWVPETSLALNLREANITTIIWSTGYGMDYSWIKIPVFDDTGYPKYHRGVTEVPGLYFLGLNWLNTWGSGRLYSVGDDAKFIFDDIKSR